MIEISHVTKTFNGQRVLDDVSLTIKDGEIFVILGESGAGKSVLLKHMVGLLKPDRGQIRLDQRDVTPLTEKEWLALRKTMGYLFQEGALYDFMNVFENIAFPLEEHTSLTHEQITKKVRDILQLIGLQGVEQKYPAQLSGGMKKRVALARAIILDSKILFCDEPTSGLDPIRSRDISDLIRNVTRKLHCTTIITSHDIANSFRIADRLVIIKDGKVAALGTQAELKVSPDQFIQAFIG
ncbi:MAG: ABC transporter ATP-binding protein [Candidatus Omnitrophota bacterium]|nr:ABC transporter ATP-binding protein [Candidatus Omnitrophota bacterium]